MGVEIINPTEDLCVKTACLEICTADKLSNLSAFERLTRNVWNGDLFVLPELFSTGFVNNRETLFQLAETDDGPTVNKVRDTAVSHGCAVCGSYLAVCDGLLRNRGFFVLPDGSVEFYDKHHLFVVGGENELMEEGKIYSPIVNYRTWRLKMAICYDIRFPLWCRNFNLEYDVLVVPANWPQSRAYAWHHLLIARAIENQAYVIGANRTGEDDGGIYTPSMSSIYDHNGRDISDHSRDSEGIVSAVLSAACISKDRSRFQPWLKADSDLLRQSRT